MMAECGSPGEALDTTLPTGSEIVFDISCTPCVSEGKHVEAEGYCTDCREHLCVQCITYHKKFAMSKHHNIVGKESAPRDIGALPVIDICTQRCQTHKDEIIKYFCPIHKNLGCSVCVTLKHRLCEDIVYIPEVSRDFQDSQDFKDFQTKLNQSIDQSQEIIQHAKDFLTSVTGCHAKTLQDIHLFRQKLNSTLDRLEEEIKQKANEIKEIDTVCIETIIKKSETVLRKLQSISSGFEALLKSQQYCQLFVDMKGNERQLSDLNNVLETLHGDKKTFRRFIPNEELQRIVRSVDNIGEISQRDPNTITANHITDITVMSASDTSACCITGITVLSDSKLVTVDVTNKSIVLINQVSYSIMSDIRLEYGPWDVATVCDSQVAVTLPGQCKIMFLNSIHDKLVFDREINVNGACRGIACREDKLFVAFDKEKKVEIMNIAGTVLQRLEKDDQGNPFFQDPTHVAIDVSGQSIYVSEWNYKMFKKIDITGKRVAEYTDPELKCACGLVVDKTGLVFVCSDDTNTVHLVTPDCFKLKLLLGIADGLKQPRSLAYCASTDKIYIGLRNTNIIKVFQCLFKS